jgi:trk system potassium uptake protein
MNSFINLRIILNLTGKILLIMSASMLLCIAVALIYGEDVLPFVYTIIVTAIPGGLMIFTNKKENLISKITRRDSYLVVSLSWFIIGAVGSLPYLFSGSMIGFHNAFFESVSGFSTTGASILTDIEALPFSILFWRSLTHWIGGIGIIVLIIVIMPSLQMGGLQLFSKESSLQEKFHPRIKTMGTRLALIYLGLTVAQIILLLFGGMNLFESVCHSFGTVATGGFSPKNTSMADYSPYIQYITTIFMFLAGTNFVVHYYLLKRDFKRAFRNEELKFYFIVVFVIGAFIGLMLFLKTGKPFEESMREAYFQLVSIVTCTGFATADYLLWPQYLWIIIFFAMFLGGSTGSTAGGIKMGRILIVLKNVKRILLQQKSSKAVVPIRYNGKVLNDSGNSSVLSFVSIYILVFAISSLLLVFLGLDLETSAGSTATCMAGIGPGIGTVGPVSNFGHLPVAAKYLLSFVMILGRLEIFTVLVIFTPSFWKS